jgi:hypothetical protein
MKFSPRFNPIIVEQARSRVEPMTLAQVDALMERTFDATQQQISVTLDGDEARIYVDGQLARVGRNEPTPSQDGVYPPGQQR